MTVLPATILFLLFFLFIFGIIENHNKNSKENSESSNILIKERLHYPKYTNEELQKDNKYIVIKKIIQEYLREQNIIKLQKIQPNTKLGDDLDFDCIDFMEITERIEDKLHVKYPDMKIFAGCAEIIDLWGLPEPISTAS